MGGVQMFGYLMANGSELSKQQRRRYSAIYCGIPAANATFHLAESVWDELGVESRE